MSAQVGEGGRVVGPEVNKFKRVSNDGHQVSLVGGGDRRSLYIGVTCPGGCTVRSHVSCILSHAETIPP